MTPSSSTTAAASAASTPPSAGPGFPASSPRGSGVVAATSRKTQPRAQPPSDAQLQLHLTSLPPIHPSACRCIWMQCTVALHISSSLNCVSLIRGGLCFLSAAIWVGRRPTHALGGQPQTTHPLSTTHRPPLVEELHWCKRINDAGMECGLKLHLMGQGPRYAMVLRFPWMGFMTANF